MKNNLEQLLLKNDIKLNNFQLEKLETFRNLVLVENQKYNLTSIVEEEDFNIKHFLDSLILLKYYDSSLFDNKLIIDVGSGGGFPGIPLAIFLPNAKFELVDATTKKTHFLKLVVEKLELKNVTIINKRAEELVEKKEKFDFAISRAFASLPINLEILSPLVKKSGKIILYRALFEKELLEKNNSKLSYLGIKFSNSFIFQLENNQNRSLLEFEKFKSIKNSIYPRKFSEIKKKDFFSSN